MQPPVPSVHDVPITVVGTGMHWSADQAQRVAAVLVLQSSHSGHDRRGSRQTLCQQVIWPGDRKV